MARAPGRVPAVSLLSSMVKCTSAARIDACCCLHRCLLAYNHASQPRFHKLIRRVADADGWQRLHEVRQDATVQSRHTLRSQRLQEAVGHTSVHDRAARHALCLQPRPHQLKRVRHELATRRRDTTCTARARQATRSERGKEAGTCSEPLQGACTTHHRPATQRRRVSCRGSAPRTHREGASTPSGRHQSRG